MFRDLVILIILIATIMLSLYATSVGAEGLESCVEKTGWTIEECAHYAS